MAALRYEHYQTESTVVVSIFKKNVPPSDVEVQFSKKFARILISGVEVLVLQPLAQETIPEQSKYRVIPVKIELTLTKAQPFNWPFLLQTTSSSSASASTPTPTVMSSSVPAGTGAGTTESATAVPPTASTTTTARAKKDWGKIVAAEAGEEKDESPMDLFQTIFKDADPDTRKAMMKSYTESNGTALSTNWEDVRKKKVEVVPPAGMESKKYEQ